MSKPSSDLSAEQIALLDAELSGFAGLSRDRLGEAVVAALLEMRGQIGAAAQNDQVSIREIARRLGVSANNVARQLSAERDMRISTAVALAYALGRKWQIDLVPYADSGMPMRNFRSVPPSIAVNTHAEAPATWISRTTTSAVPAIEVGDTATAAI